MRKKIHKYIQYTNIEYTYFTIYNTYMLLTKVLNCSLNNKQIEQGYGKFLKDQQFLNSFIYIQYYLNNLLI